jgi:CRISPR-associated protein Csy3
MSNLKLPTVLAFDRKLEPSDALMYSGNWDGINDNSQWHAIELFDRRNRAVKSNFKKEVLNNEEVLQKKIVEANLAWGDDAALAHDNDTLKMNFSLRILSGLDRPSVCNNVEFERIFNQKISNYINLNIEELAKRYAYNIANGRFLWRNRVGAQEVKVFVSHSSLNSPLEFNAYDFSLNNTTADDISINVLAKLIQSGFAGNGNTFLTIVAYAKLGEGQRIWPSQEMVLDIPKGEKSRLLFNLHGKAAMHCEKIGNALRTIDDWYPGAKTPIAIEAYGSVTQRGVAYRSSKNDFKTLLLKWLNDKETSDEDKHFVAAMVVRGGVFGEKIKE